MNFENQPWCRCCQRPMETVAEIDPIGCKSGFRLVAFICDECGATDSALINPDNAAADHRGSVLRAS